MSDLILPKQYQNDVLKRNLDAFFRRYPHERSRLESLLSEPVDRPAEVRIELPQAPSKPPMRVLLLAGMNSASFVADVLTPGKLNDDNFQVFIVENNEKFLKGLFQYTDLTGLLLTAKAEWILMHNEESIKPCFFRILKQEATAAMMRNVSILETARPQPAEVEDFYKKLPQIYDETVHHVMHNFGRINDSLDGIRATLMNADTILSNPGIDDLKGFYRGMPALIIGAGPSLDREIETIKANNDKFVVIAADAALKPLLKHGIRVDYVTSIERLNDYQRPFFEGLPKIDTELVAFPVVLPSQFELYPGPIRLVYRNYSFFAYFEKSWPKGIIKCGGSTSHLALRLADWFGCSRAFLIGLDSCYEKKDDLYRSHCSDTGHEEWSKFVPLNEFTENRKHLPPIMARNNQGEEVVTNLTYYQWGKELGEELSEVGFRMPLTNCSSIGLAFDSIPYKPLAEIADRLDPLVLEKPVKKPIIYHRKFNHKEVIQNFNAWLTLINDSITECDNLSQEEIIEEARYEALMFIYNFRICVDAMFVAFIVQCCAKEFFELENLWWALDKNWALERKEKIQITKNKLELFKDVTTQLLAILKETANGGD